MQKDYYITKHGIAITGLFVHQNSVYRKICDLKKSYQTGQGKRTTNDIY